MASQIVKPCAASGMAMNLRKAASSSAMSTVRSISGTVLKSGKSGSAPMCGSGGGMCSAIWGQELAGVHPGSPGRHTFVDSGSEVRMRSIRSSKSIGPRCRPCRR